MKYCLILFFSLPFVLSLDDRSLQDIQEQWNIFKTKHQKTYMSTKDELLRRSIFMQNVKEIEEHNKYYKLGLVTYKLGTNRFSDMSHEEYLKYIHADTAHEIDPTKLSERSGIQFSTYNAGKFFSKIPKQIDWRKRGAVTPVKNQGGCGSCWAFAAVGAMESQNFRKTKKLVRLSEQQMIDCSTKYGNMACKGGFLIHTYEYVMDNGGISKEKSYPYEGKLSKCRYKPRNKGGVVNSYIHIAAYNETELKMAIATIGPVTVSIDASPRTFQLYKSGVYSDPVCSRTKLNHAVLAVGYGREKGQDYWIIKNSWNTKWGDKGYIKIARNKNNVCGVATYANTPLVK